MCQTPANQSPISQCAARAPHPAGKAWCSPSLGGPFERQAPLHCPDPASAAPQFGALPPPAGLVDLQQVDRLVVALEAVDPHDDALPALDLLLVPVARLGDLALRETGDRRDHAAHFVDAPDVVVGRGFAFERQLLRK
jgi:hypothetical protein